MPGLYQGILMLTSLAYFFKFFWIRLKFWEKVKTKECGLDHWNIGRTKQSLNGFKRKCN